MPRYVGTGELALGLGTFLGTKTWFPTFLAERDPEDSVPNPVPNQDDDESYQAFLVATASECRSCSTCTGRPCAACAAGGLCDRMCWCGDNDDDLDHEGDDLGGDL